MGKVAWLLMGALLVQSALGAPAACNECVGDVESVNSGFMGGYRSHSAKSSYKASYRYSSSGVGAGSSSRRLMDGRRFMVGAGGLGSTGGRLENFDDSSVVGSSGGSGIGLGTGRFGLNLDRAGTWRDEKHYITDDGRGAANFKAGQTVFDNGYSKFASSSWRYGSHDQNARLSNAEVVSAAEFEQELQNMRSRINSFMGNFNVDSGALTSGRLESFKTSANLISSEMNRVCDNLDHGSARYRQMHDMLEQFNRDVEQRQQQMEQQLYHESSVSSMSSRSSYQGSLRPTVPASQLAPVQQYPVRPQIDQDRIAQQRIEDQITSVQDQISTFYSTFGSPDVSPQYQQELNGKVDYFMQKLNDLSFEAQQHESVKVRIENVKGQLEHFVSQIRKRIGELEQRNREMEARRKEREEQLRLEKIQYEKKVRELEEQRQQLEREEETRRELRRQEEAQLKIKAEEERIRLQKEEAERLRIQQEETERLRLRQQEEAERLRLEREEAEKARLRQIEEENARLRQLEEENLKIQRERLTAPQAQVKPDFGGHHGSVEISSSYQHQYKGSYNSQSSQGRSGSYVQQQPSQPLIQPHVDLTAAVGRLQQDLNRLQSEVNSFNAYSMRLTSSNSQNVVREAEREAETIRERLSNLCETSGRYQSDNVHESAEKLRQHFEDLFISFQNQAANLMQQSGSAQFGAAGEYSSGSNYQKLGRISASRPASGKFEYEHSKSTEVEIGNGSSAPQRFASGASFSGQGAFGAKRDDEFTTGLIDLGQGSSSGQQQRQQVECVEAYANQPCLNESSRRYRRDAGVYDSYKEDNRQRDRQAPLENYSTRDRIPDYNSQYPILEDYNPNKYKKKSDNDRVLLQFYRRYVFGLGSQRSRRNDGQSPSALEIVEESPAALERLPKSYEYPSNRELMIEKPLKVQPINEDYRGFQEEAMLIDDSKRPMPLTHQEMIWTDREPSKMYGNSRLNVDVNEPRVLPVAGLIQLEEKPESSRFHDFRIETNEKPNEKSILSEANVSQKDLVLDQNHENPSFQQRGFYDETKADTYHSGGEFNLENSGFNDENDRRASFSQTTERIEKPFSYNKDIDNVNSQTDRSRGISKPEQYGKVYDDPSHASMNSYKIKHPGSHYIDTANMQEQRSQDYNLKASKDQLQSSTQVDNPSTTEFPFNSIIILPSTEEPEPKLPSQTRPWHINHSNENKEDKGPQRGDISGNSEPTEKILEIPKHSPEPLKNPTTSDPITTSTTTTTTTTTTARPEVEQIETTTARPRCQSLPCRSKCHSSGCRANSQDQFGGTFHINHHHNFSYTHNLNYHGQMNEREQINQRVQYPLHENNDRYIQRYQEHHRGRFEFQHHRPPLEYFEPSFYKPQSNLDRIINFNQQVRKPTFDDKSFQEQYNQHHQFSFNHRTEHYVKSDSTRNIEKPQYIDTSSSHHSTWD
ncbi:hypothetical protein TKK_0011124 [Trichogramma kaykai]|uniref:Uncharacterized protein n=1 Tax=Trichogramma kaykai TaxID=54128 RepID=A0ABD2WUH6_9HYME